MLRLRGAVNIQQIASAYLILVVSAIYLAILSLAVSAMCRQSRTALVIAYVVALVLFGILLVPAAIMLESQSGDTAALLHYLRGFSPFAAMLSLMRPNPGDFDGASHELAPLWKVFLCCAAGLSAISYALIIWKLSRPASAPAQAGGAEPSSDSRLASLLILIDPKKPHMPIGRRNPIMVNEARTNQLGSGRWMIRVFYVSLFLSMGLALMSLYGGTEHPDLLNYVVRVLIVLQMGVVLLISPSLTSASVSGDIELGTFELLRLAPMRGDNFLGKISADPVAGAAARCGALACIRHTLLPRPSVSAAADGFVAHCPRDHSAVLRHGHRVLNGRGRIGAGNRTELFERVRSSPIASAGLVGTRQCAERSRCGARRHDQPTGHGTQHRG